MFSTLFVFAGGGVAHAQPTFAVAEQHARAGDTVHFSIAGATSRVDYEIEVDDTDVLRGSAAGAMIAGEFTMPDLGESTGTVKVEAEMRQSGKKTKVKPRIEYLGRALPRAEPAPAAQPPAPAAMPNAVLPPAAPPSSAPAPIVAPKAIGTLASPARAVKRRARHTGARRRAVDRSPRDESTKRKARRKRGERDARTRRPRARTAPLFDGVPEPQSGGAKGPDGAIAPQNAVTAPKTVADATATRAADTNLSISMLVPGMLGMAALTLTGAALHRRRTLRRR